MFYFFGFLQSGVIETVVSSIKKWKKLNSTLERGSGARKNFTKNQTYKYIYFWTKCPRKLDMNCPKKKLDKLSEKLFMDIVVQKKLDIFGRERRLVYPIYPPYHTHASTPIDFSGDQREHRSHARNINSSNKSFCCYDNAISFFLFCDKFPSSQR